MREGSESQRVYLKRLSCSLFTIGTISRAPSLPPRPTFVSSMFACTLLRLFHSFNVCTVPLSNRFFSSSSSSSIFGSLCIGVSHGSCALTPFGMIAFIFGQALSIKCLAWQSHSKRKWLQFFSFFLWGVQTKVKPNGGFIICVAHNQQLYCVSSN